MYSITNYFANSTTLEFTNLQTKQKFSFKISNNKENRYKQVSKKYYIEVSTGDLIIINDDTLPLENRYQNIDGSLYRRATQTEFDKWMHESYPESDNASVYGLFTSGILNEMEKESESEEEDPYYRGNIETLLKQRQ